MGAQYIRVFRSEKITSLRPCEAHTNPFKKRLLSWTQRLNASQEHATRTKLEKSIMTAFVCAQRATLAACLTECISFILWVATAPGFCYLHQASIICLKADVVHANHALRICFFLWLINIHIGEETHLYCKAQLSRARHDMCMVIK
jgi:hypothetical protein